ncbi:molybdopterin molybdenumtransferase MoeA [Pseudoalteromonas sp. S1727]|uniref:molybdopterin molybdotransferase MoeA n=1 Tax=Pseudoalteromonas sp. S1727 TaxID=2066514 RepID=UPI00110935F6|nr:gephyrin-like molybdotransferase Glp [Pseudoalteromonas sp. S1727]TMN70078.1 molybdopterin molybdenumtransferase MoeA [Pseudoalteromonas sp. S1727]
MNDCFNASGLLSVESAIENILSTIKPVEQHEQISLFDSLDRVLAKELISDINVPIHDNSAMDGYAICYQSSSNTYKQVGSVLAGEYFEPELNPGECVRIMTGALVPKGCDAVIMQENATKTGNSVTINQKIKMADNIRRAGEDIPKGATVLTQGHKLTPVDLGLLASLGINQLTVYKKLTVAVFSTGDELTLPGQPLKTGAIYESNRAVLIASLQKLAFDVIDLGIVKDTKTAIKDAFLTADLAADVVISSGGVSVGDADYTKEVLNEIGEIGFWKIAMKPGKPFAFGKLPNSYFFGLPGNPVSAIVTFMQLVCPALNYLSAQAKIKKTNKLSAITTTAIKKRPGRTDFQRAIATIDNNGFYTVSALPYQGSGVLTSMSKANCFIILPADCAGVAKGAQVDIEMFK